GRVGQGQRARARLVQAAGAGELAVHLQVVVGPHRRRDGAERQRPARDPGVAPAGGQDHPRADGERVGRGDRHTPAGAQPHRVHRRGGGRHVRGHVGVLGGAEDGGSGGVFSGGQGGKAGGGGGGGEGGGVDGAEGLGGGRAGVAAELEGSAAEGEVAVDAVAVVVSAVVEDEGGAGENAEGGGGGHRAVSPREDDGAAGLEAVHVAQ